MGGKVNTCVDTARHCVHTVTWKAMTSESFKFKPEDLRTGVQDPEDYFDDP